jgi:hypothetical protein
MRQLRMMVTAALAAYSVPVVADARGASLLNCVNIAVHETGHVLFAQSGGTLALLGGTLLQLLLPLALAMHFTMRRDEHAASVCVWWIGQNLIVIGSMMAGTTDLALPDPWRGEQEWHLLFGQWDVILFAMQYAQLTRGLGVLVMLVSVVWGVCEALRTPPRRALAEPRYHRLRVR